MSYFSRIRHTSNKDRTSVLVLTEGQGLRLRWPEVMERWWTDTAGVTRIHHTGTQKHHKTPHTLQDPTHPARPHKLCKTPDTLQDPTHPARPHTPCKTPHTLQDPTNPARPHKPCKTPRTLWDSETPGRLQWWYYALRHSLSASTPLSCAFTF